jgi:repressor LexA
MASKNIMVTAKERALLNELRRYLKQKGESPSVRTLMVALGYKSPRSVTSLLENLAKKGIIERKPNKELRIIPQQEESFESTETVAIPLLGSVACGDPIFAEESVEMMIPVSRQLASSADNYFFLRAQGDSMNEKDINDGDYVLIRKQNVARNGDLVVALIDDEATIKEYRKEPGAIILKPHSTNPDHLPTVLNRDFRIQGIVVTSISKHNF